MSVHMTSWAWKQTVGDAGAKLLLVKLADQANDNGECWPSQMTLARECEMSRRTVQRKLEVLAELELVETEQRMRTRGGKTSLLYRLTMRQVDASRCVTGDVTDASVVTHPREPSLEPIDPSDAVTSSVDGRTASVRETVERSLRAVS